MRGPHLSIIEEPLLAHRQRMRAWQKELPMVEKLVQDHEGSLLHASNFSVGVNIFFEINRKLAEIMNKHYEYNHELMELGVHVHNQIFPRINQSFRPSYLLELQVEENSH